ncbi:hypothetical protein BT63DRAFT_420549 [Microthyrium microscopicum]|uniref:YTH domain-containing protein n=1 Tax=Microthyrium microscopicum TaxID=703497 RepID=A0A6A6UWA6_9PEZI|nr:hypothetical protein BT63DRAFT_420549 [Microthyrium microscopicum]
MSDPLKIKKEIADLHNQLNRTKQEEGNLNREISKAEEKLAKLFTSRKSVTRTRTKLENGIERLKADLDRFAPEAVAASELAEQLDSLSIVKEQEKRPRNHRRSDRRERSRSPGARDVEIRKRSRSPLPARKPRAGTTAYFITKSEDERMLQGAKDDNVWVECRRGERELTVACANCESVYLIFHNSTKTETFEKLKTFEGLALLETAPSQKLRIPNWTGVGRRAKLMPMRIKWINKNKVNMADNVDLVKDLAASLPSDTHWNSLPGFDQTDERTGSRLINWLRDAPPYQPKVVYTEPNPDHPPEAMNKETDMNDGPSSVTHPPAITLPHSSSAFHSTSMFLPVVPAFRPPTAAFQAAAEAVQPSPTADTHITIEDSGAGSSTWMNGKGKMIEEAGNEAATSNDEI